MNGFDTPERDYGEREPRRTGEGRPAVTAMAVEPHQNWSYLLETWRTLDVPDGWRAEIEEGQIILVPPPGRAHNLIAGEVHEELVRCLPRGVGVYQTLGAEIARLEKVYVPDLVVVDKAVLMDADSRDANPIDASDILLAVEITSFGNARHDRTRKLWAYAHAPVPLYLLIDRFDEHGPTVTVFSEPLNGAYQRGIRTSFGKPASLPEPFGVELRTEDFPVPQRPAGQ